LLRRTEAAAQSDDVLLIRVIIAEKLHDAAFVEAYTTGFDELSAYVTPFTPAWAAEQTGVDANQIVSFARAYGSTGPAMIVLGGSSMHKSDNGWQAARAISCLPALTDCPESQAEAECTEVRSDLGKWKH
jgi:anaerobic selenocysteine-containing dehydrogenase